MELVKGVPADLENRSENEQKSFNFLQESGVEFWYVDHKADEIEEVYQTIDLQLNSMHCKNLLLTNRQKSSYYLLMMPYAKRFDTSRISSALGSSRLQFASDEDLEKILGVKKGCASPLSLLNDPHQKVTFVIDNDIAGKDFVGFLPGINTTSIRVKTEDFFGVIVPRLKHRLKRLKIN